MSAFRYRPARTLPLTGERTVPGLAEENYWFRRHEVVYRAAGRPLRGSRRARGRLRRGLRRRPDRRRWHAVSSGWTTTSPRSPTSVPATHGWTCVTGTWPSCRLPTAAVDVVVNFQVIEHLWDQGQFVAECLRVLRPGGVLLMSTPNRITFSPGRDTPINPFHTRELNAAELTELLTDAGFGRGDARRLSWRAARRTRRPARRLDHRRPDRAGVRRRTLAH